jgi:hypothetical protein
VSEVLVSVSTESMLKLRCTTRRSIPSRGPCSSLASVKRYTSMVAMLGSIIPEPLATAVSTASPTETDTALGWVSVVMIPSAPTSGSSCRSPTSPGSPSR